MKKNLLIALVLVLPFMASAQDEAPVYKDFYSKSKEIPASFILNDHVNIMMANKDNDTFDVIAVSDQMQVLWTTQMKGHPVAGAKFKGKILAVASTEYSGMKAGNNTYNGYVIDPANGKVLLEKMIYDGSSAYMVIPYIATGEGDYFKMAIRQTGFERRVHVATPLSFFSNNYTKQLNETKGLEVVEFNDKLEAVNKFQPQLPGGDFLALTFNNAGDMFISWFTDKGVDFVRYGAAKNSQPVKISTDASFTHDKGDIAMGLVQIVASKKDPAVLLYTMMYKNVNKDNELGVGRLDFNTNKKKVVTEVFIKDHIKSLEKAFVPVNKKMDKPDMGSAKLLNVRHLLEDNGHLVVTITGRSSSQGTMGVWELETSTLLNVYDADLNLKAQQFVPSGYSMPARILSSGYYIKNDKLYTITNDKQGMTTMYATYGVLDLNSGKWDKMVWLSKKHISNSDFAGSSCTLWYPNALIVPYIDVRNGIGTTKYDVTLQQNPL